MRLYHGTRESFAALETGRPTQLPSAGLVWLTADRRHAESYARYGEGSGPAQVLVCEASYERPFDVGEDDACRAQYDAWVAERVADGLEVATAGRAPEGYDTDGWPHYDNNAWLAEAAREAGYDAILTSDGNGQIGVGVYDAAAIMIVDRIIVAPARG